MGSKVAVASGEGDAEGVAVTVGAIVGSVVGLLSGNGGIVGSRDGVLAGAGEALGVPVGDGEDEGCWVALDVAEEVADSVAVAVGVRVGSGVGVGVEVSVAASVSVASGDGVRDGLGIGVGSGVSVTEGVDVGLGDGVDVDVGDDDGEGVTVRVGAIVAVRVGALVGDSCLDGVDVGSAVRVRVADAVTVAVGVAVSVGVGVEVGCDVAVWVDVAVSVTVIVGVAVVDGEAVGSGVRDGVAVSDGAWPGGVTAIGSREATVSTGGEDGCDAGVAGNDAVAMGDAATTSTVGDPSSSKDSAVSTTGEPGTGVEDSPASTEPTIGVAIGVPFVDGRMSGWGDAASGEPLDVASPAAAVGVASSSCAVVDADAASPGVASSCGGATIRGVSVASATAGDPKGTPINVLGDASARIEGADSVAARSAASWVNTGGATVTTISRGDDPDLVRSNARSRLDSTAPVATIALVRFTSTSPLLDNRLPAPPNHLVR